MELSDITVAIVGGGPGGLAVATALAQRGARVDLFERAPVFAEVGAGIQISANGQRVLHAIGATGGGVPDRASVSTGTQFRDGPSGRKVTFVPAPFAGPTWYLHRADLLDLLRVSADRAGATLHTGRVVTPGSVAHDLVVAADGGQSVWRSHVDGPDSAVFTGQVAWRALVPGLFEDDAASLAMGHRAHVVNYPLRNNTLMNIVAVEERSSWSEEGWDQPGSVAEFRDRFSDFGGELSALLDHVETVHLWALHARPVAGRWVRDNIALLGDAAHPTLPFMAQGACLALEDAQVLADALTHAPDLSAGLLRYQDLRRHRAERVVGLARSNAWRFHLGKPWSWGAQAVLAVGGSRLARRLEWVYAYDATRAAHA